MDSNIFKKLVTLSNSIAPLHLSQREHDAIITAYGVVLSDPVSEDVKSLKGSGSDDAFVGPGPRTTYALGQAASAFPTQEAKHWKTVSDARVRKVREHVGTAPFRAADVARALFGRANTRTTSRARTTVDYMLKGGLITRLRRGVYQFRK